MKTLFIILLTAVLLLFLNSCSAKADNGDSNGKEISLPAVVSSQRGTVSNAIFNRHAVRRFGQEPLSVNDIATCLWAGGGKTIDGVTGATRSYAAAGGIYPLEFYLIAENVSGLEKGIYHYQWKDHSLKLVKAGSFKKKIAGATYSMSFKTSHVPACIVITAIPSKTISKYGERGAARYVPMAVGGSGQTIALQAEALGLGTYVIGAFNDQEMKDILGLQEGEEFAMYIMPIGKPSR